MSDHRVVAKRKLLEFEIAETVAQFAQATVPGCVGIVDLVAQRVTGTPGLGGLWQCYTHVPRELGGGLNSCGAQIHASSDGECSVYRGRSS